MEEKKLLYRRNAAFIARLLAFLLIFAVLCAAALYVLTPKSDFGMGSMLNLYFQPGDSIDVLAMGTSMTYAGLNTNVLWANWGITAYDLACAEQQYWNTYYYLLEALKTQTPRLILLDAKAATYPDDSTKRGRAIMSTYGILSPITRLCAIRATAGEDWLSYYLAFPQVHENWKRLSAESFALPDWTGGRSLSWKGFVESPETERHSKPSLIWTNIRKNINDREIEYFHKICDLAQENGIPILLIAYPNPDYANDHMYYNALWSIADERGVPHLNLNNPEGGYRFRYSTEFADWQHLNVLGSMKFSKIVGAYVAENYELPDHRGEAGYESWDACLAEWRAAWPELASQIEIDGEE